MAAPGGEARACYRSAVLHAPQIACHHYLPGTLLPFAGMQRCRELLERALELAPSFACAQAALGNIAIREGRTDDALAAYRSATAVDPEFAPAHLALGALLEALRNDTEAARHYRRAWSLQQFYRAPSAAPVRRVLVLKAPANALANPPIDFAVNTARTALDVLYLGPGLPAPPALPDYDVIYGGMSEFESLQAALDCSLQWIASKSIPVVNHPKRLTGVRRAQLGRSLAAVANCSVPATIRLERTSLRGDLPFPVLIRPVDSHRGDGLARLDDHCELQSYLKQSPHAAFFVSAFVDYRSSDGLYRKYRVTVVDGEPFPYHLAISEGWMASYASSLTRHHAWMRAEEERFLRDPSSVFPTWDATFGEIARALGMEYVSLDCTRGPGGGVVVFEAGPNMLVHCRDTDETLSYKYGYVPRIFDALDRLLEKRTAPARQSD